MEAMHALVMYKLLMCAKILLLNLLNTFHNTVSKGSVAEHIDDISSKTGLSITLSDVHAFMHDLIDWQLKFYFFDFHSNVTV